LTCWTILVAAAAGSASHRAEFARRYGPVVRAYLAARWRASPCQAELDDAVQEAFVECFKPGGVLERAERGRARGFRPFLFGAVRHVALRFERARGRRREMTPPDERSLEAVPDGDPGPSRAFDRAWATALVREAAQL
jgi:RNA polymerase sigma-70 factor (ECF subfamily)